MWKKPVPILGEAKFKADQFQGTIIGRCNCGSSIPIAVPIIPGSGIAVACPQCGVRHKAEMVTWDEPTPQEGQTAPIRSTLNVRVRSMVPDVARVNS